mmetsp:Transcript_6655/g.16608  ORF Transcript_6655/g.16608 Transcript_6655/m.16608 type:complete len:81 (-) Transcript_6655:397-639(-)
MKGLKESQKPNCSSNRFGQTQTSYPTIQTHRKRNALTEIRKKMKSKRLTDRYHTKTFKNVGQIWKQTQQKNPKTNAAVIK